MSSGSRPVVYPPRVDSNQASSRGENSSNPVAVAYSRTSSESQSHNSGHRNSGNYPDIVDSDNCFLPSESFTDLRNTMEVPNDASNQYTVGAGETRPNNHSPRTSEQPQSPGVVSEHRRSISAIIDHQQALEQSDNQAAIQRASPTDGLYPAIPTTSTGGVTVITPTTVMGSTHISTHDLNVGIVPGMDSHREALPDLLHSHVIPSHVTPSSRHGHHHIPPGVDPRVYAYHQSQGRHHSRHHRGGRSSRDRERRRSRSRSGSQMEDEPCKAGCMNCLAASTSFRWILVILSLLGVCCVVTGIVLAALHAAGNSFLFLAIMFIGLGVLLVVVVAVGWKCTPRGHEPLHALFGLGDFRHQPRERRHRRHGHHRRREGQWYGGVMYPEFQYRRPPPSYNVSMQEFQHQLVLAQSQPRNFDDVPAEDYSLPSSPPPSYRSRASTVRTGIQITFPPSRSDQPNSRPPTYRSHVGTGSQPGHARPSLPRDDNGNVVTGGDIQIEVPNISAVNIISTNTAVGDPGTAGTSSSHQTVPSGISTSATSTQNTGATGQTTVSVITGTTDLLQVQRTLGTKNTDTVPNNEQTAASENEDEYPIETPL